MEEGEWYVLVYLNWNSVWIESTSANNYIVLPFKIVQSTNFGPNYFNSLEIKLYPNPAREFVFLESTEILEEYCMTDLNGRVVDNGKPMNTKARIAVDALPPGYYQLLVRTGKGLQVLRFAIE